MLLLPVNRGRACKLVLTSVACATLTAVAPAAETPAQRKEPQPSAAQVRAAAAWAGHRRGTIAWAVLDARGRLRHRNGTRPFPSASVSKAMLLVGVLRRYRDRPVPVRLRKLLDPMIRVSGNRAASAVHRRFGDALFQDVARAAGLRRLLTNGTWSEVQLTATDLARFFLRVDRLVPPRHRAYAHALLEGIVPEQSWGIPRALRPHGWRVRFKGGWRRKLVHQGALAERDGRRVALAILTDANPSHEYGRGTLEGIARRLLGA
jgi:Beta-lactamase enzyme family